MEDPSPSPSADNSDPNPDVKQNITGDRNQVNGKMIGSNAFNFPGDRHSINITIQPENTTASTNSSIAKSQDSQIGENPYQGLDAFLEDDSDRFFGRKSQIDDLSDKFRSLHQDNSKTRLLIIYGASGSGKSSLARAGLIAKLNREPLPGQKQSRGKSLVPHNIPLEELAKTLVRIATNGESSPAKIREFKDELSRINADSVYDGLRRIANSLPEIDNSPLILLVDQFEELFTARKDQKDQFEQDAFIGNLLHAAADSSKQVSVIITVRSDFLGKCPQIDRLIQTQGFFVAAMDEAGRREAISEPAKLAGRPLDLSMVNLLIEQTKGREGALPLLQFALEQIWVGLQNGKEPAETLESIGGVGGALAGKAQKIYENLDSTEREIARRVFLGLVHLGEGAKDTRRRAELIQLCSHGDSLEQVREVTTKFAHQDARLITLANEGGVETAEVTHEALFEHWDRFNVWLNEGRDNLRLQRRLSDVVADWKKNKPSGSLWRSPDLDLLRRYQERAGDDMTPFQLEFFRASIDAEKAQAQAEEKRLQADRDLAEERLRTSEERLRKNQEIAEERLRAEKQKNKHRRFVFISWSLFVFLVAAILIVVSNGIYLRQKNTDLYNQYAYCLKEKGRPGEWIEKTKSGKEVCFRDIITSGEVGVFLSSTNFHLARGVEAFKEKKYEKSISLFEQAIAGDRSDPVPWIFRNNAKARQREKDLNIKPLKLAVVISIDYYEETAKEVLRGVADAQDRFNQSRKEIGNKNPLLEIVIANDENEKAAAKKVAEKLVNDDKIIGIVGHHSSESTTAAQEIYNSENVKIAVISPSSSSSALTGEQFFRTTGDTKKAATKYVAHIKKISNSNKAIVFYTKGSEYSESLLSDFTKERGQVIEYIDLNLPIDIPEKIKKIAKSDKIKNLLVFSSINTNSVAIAIAKANAELPINQKLNLLGAWSLSEQETINRGGSYVNGMYLVRPCIAPKSTYMMNDAKKWSKENDSWRNATSYDATQAFIKAIKRSKPVTRKEILNQLNSISLNEEETSGFGLTWDKSDRSNQKRKFCVVQIENNKFMEVKL